MSKTLQNALRSAPTLGETQTSPRPENVDPARFYAVPQPVLPVPGVFLGGVSVETWCILCSLPQDGATGAQLRGLKFMVSEDLIGSDTDYWLLQLGKTVNGTFKNVGTQTPLSSNLARGTVKLFNFPDPVHFSRGDTVTVLISPRGLPSPLVGVSLAPDWGVQAFFRGTGARGSRSGGSRG